MDNPEIWRYFWKEIWFETSLGHSIANCTNFLPWHTQSNTKKKHDDERSLDLQAKEFMNMILAEYMKFDLKNMLKMRICCFSKQLFNMRKMMQLMSTRIQINKVFLSRLKLKFEFKIALDYWFVMIRVVVLIVIYEATASISSIHWRGSEIQFIWWWIWNRSG